MAADVADDVDITEVMGGAHHVSDRLDDVDVSAHALLEHVGRVSRRAKAEDVELGSLFANPRA